MILAKASFEFPPVKEMVLSPRLGVRRLLSLQISETVARAYIDSAEVNRCHTGCRRTNSETDFFFLFSFWFPFDQGVWRAPFEKLWAQRSPSARRRAGRTRSGRPGASPSLPEHGTWGAQCRAAPQRASLSRSASALFLPQETNGGSDLPGAQLHHVWRCARGQRPLPAP